MDSMQYEDGLNHSDSGDDEFTSAATSQSTQHETEEEKTSEVQFEDLNLPTEDKEKIIQCVHDLKFKDKREKALSELLKKRECLQDLAPVIWHSIGTIAALLQEIVSIYPLLSPSNMTGVVSNRACNVLALLQCVAAHSETRSAFLKANIPLFLYPFLNTINKGRAYEYLRLTSLGVIGALIKIDDPEVINFLLHTEIIPLSLRIMERGTELSQTVATFIIQKILSDTNGLSYICQTRQRFFTVITVMDTMVKSQIKNQPSQRLLKHIARCYQKLFENQKAKESLAEQIPTILSENSLEAYFDENTKQIISGMREAIDTWRSENSVQANVPMMESQYQPRMGAPDPALVKMGSHGVPSMMNKTSMMMKVSGRNSAEPRAEMMSRPTVMMSRAPTHAYHTQMQYVHYQPTVSHPSTGMVSPGIPTSSQPAMYMQPSAPTASYQVSPGSNYNYRMMPNKMMSPSPHYPQNNSNQ